MNPFDPDGEEILRGRPQPDDPDRVQGAALVAIGGEIRLVLGFGLAAGSAPDQRLDLDTRRATSDTGEEYEELQATGTEAVA